MSALKRAPNIFDTYRFTNELPETRVTNFSPSDDEKLVETLWEVRQFLNNTQQAEPSGFFDYRNYCLGH